MPSIAAVLVLLIVALALGMRAWRAARTLLQVWANANALTILQARRAWLPPLSMLFTTSRFQVVYHVSVYDEQTRRIRSAWVRLGTWWLGLMNPDAIDVRWENEG